MSRGGLSESQILVVFSSLYKVLVCSEKTGLLHLHQHSLETQLFPCNFTSCLCFPVKRAAVGRVM